VIKRLVSSPKVRLKAFPFLNRLTGQFIVQKKGEKGIFRAAKIEPQRILQRKVAGSILNGSALFLCAKLSPKYYKNLVATLSSAVGTRVLILPLTANL
jgi:hypothetical protein